MPHALSPTRAKKASSLPLLGYVTATSAPPAELHLAGLGLSLIGRGQEVLYARLTDLDVEAAQVRTALRRLQIRAAIRLGPA